MKLCIPVAAPEGLAAALEPDFGAAQHLLIIEDDGKTIHAVDRAHPELIKEEAVAGIEGILCGEIHPRLLYELQQNGIQIYGCEAPTASAALDQFLAGELEAAPAFSLPPEMQGGCGCGHKHGEEAEGGCCGGHGEGEGCGCGDKEDKQGCCGGGEHGAHGGHGGGCGCAH